MKTCPQCGGSFDTAQQFCPRDGQVLNDSGQDLIGKVLDGKYEIEAFVASGGMGTVYRARHILLGDKVAIKVLLPEFRANPEWLRRFQREGQAARRFNHPNAVAVYDLGTSSEGLVYMVMEFVEGLPLDEELRQRGRYSPEDALEVLEPVGRVLESAHRQGVVHRDLKPANVMVKRLEGGGVWIELLDLGIAKLSDFKDAAGDEGSPLTVAGQMLGTPYYMSPEQWGERQRDGNAEIDGRADIYSLGLMFYELISGSRPFEAKTLVELRLFHAAINPKRLDLAVPGVPEDYGLAVERAMAKDRGDRYAHAAEFIEDLRAALGLPPGGATTVLGGSTSSLVGRTGAHAQSPTTLHAQSPTNETASRDHANDHIKTAIMNGAQSTASQPPAPPTTPLPPAAASDSRVTDARQQVASQREGFEPPPTLIANPPAGAPASGPASAAPPQPSPAAQANAPTPPASFTPPQPGTARSEPVVDAAKTNVMAQPFTSQPNASTPPSAATAPPVAATTPLSPANAPPAFAGAPRPNTGSFAPNTSAQFAPAAQATHQVAPPRKKSRGALVAFIVVLLLAVCVGIAGVGWFVWHKWQQTRIVMTGSPPADGGTTPTGPTAGGAKTGDATDTGGAVGAAATGARAEALSYWIEAFDSPDQKQGQRVAQSGSITLGSGQEFRFHFSPATRGFLYIVGPGQSNEPTAFLTAQPNIGLLKTNLAAADADFSFPYGQGQVFQLDKNPGTEEYTVIFSETPLMEPKFLSQRGGHALTPAELKQLEDLRSRAKTAAPAQDVKDSGDGRAVSVTVPKEAAPQGLVVFDVRIEHH